MAVNHSRLLYYNCINQPYTKVKILTDILRRIRRENSIEFPKEINIHSFEKVLIVAPHPDDEVIGAFGWIYNHKNVDIILITDGSNGIPGKNRNQTTLIRYEEFKNALKPYPIKRITCLEIEDGKVQKNKKEFEKLNLDSYDLILTPNLFDLHPDHFYTTQFITANCFNSKKKQSIGLYEIWGALPVVNAYINIEKYIEQKINAIKKHKSQCEIIDYSERISALNHYRGILVDKKFIECYWILDKFQMKKLLNL